MGEQAEVVKEEQVFETEPAKEKVVEPVPEQDKGKELESLYMKRLNELSEREKQLQPYMELNNYLQSNPDKAQKIAKLLSGEEVEEDKPKEDASIFDDSPKDDKIKELKEEIKSVKDLILSSSQKEVEKKVEEDINKRVEGYKSSYGKDFDGYKYFAIMQAYPEGFLNQLSEEKFHQLSDDVAKQIAAQTKREREASVQEYLKEKKEIATKTNSETKPSPTGKEKKEIEISFNNAKQIATDILKSLHK